MAAIGIDQSGFNYFAIVPDEFKIFFTKKRCASTTHQQNKYSEPNDAANTNTG